MGHIVSKLKGYDTLLVDIQAVLDSLAPREVEVQTNEGAWYMMRILPYRTLDNAIEGAVLTFVNITEEKQAKEAAFDNQLRLQAIFDHSPLTISEFDSQGRYARVNHAVGDFFNRPPSEVLGQTFDTLLPPDTAKLFKTRIAMVLDTGKSVNVEETLMVGKTHQRFMTTLFPLFDATGAVRTIGAISQKVTTPSPVDPATGADPEKQTKTKGDTP